MRSLLITALFLLTISTPAFSLDEDSRYAVEVSSADAGPGDTGSSMDGSDDDSDGPACDFIDQALTTDCTVYPDTPAQAPADAPDECIDWDYDDFWSALYRCG